MNQVYGQSTALGLSKHQINVFDFSTVLYFLTLKTVNIYIYSMM